VTSISTETVRHVLNAAGGSGQATKTWKANDPLFTREEELDPGSV
jgi:hypothetical protein